MSRSARLLAVAGCALALTVAEGARAAGTLSDGGAHRPLSVRAAVRSGEAPTTSWVEVRAEANAGAFALVVPVRFGSSLDLATEAWMEALALATAPHVVGPSGSSLSCPGDPPREPLDRPDPLEVVPVLSPLEVEVFDDLVGLEAWALSRGLTVSGAQLDLFESAGVDHFVALRFFAPGARFATPTVRVTSPSGPAVLPLAFVLAHPSQEIDVTGFVFAPGRAVLLGTEVEIDLDELALDAATGESNYLDLRRSALLPPGTSLVESASHTALVSPVAVLEGVAIDPVVRIYFERAAAYGATSEDPLACVVSATTALELPSPIGPACPRGELLEVGEPPACDWAAPEGATAAASLVCGEAVDDLALAATGFSGSSVWLTRFAMRIPAGGSSAEEPVQLSAGAEVSPVRGAAIDWSSCGGEGGQSGSGPVGAGPVGAGPGAGAGAGPTYVDVPVRVYEGGCGCTGEYVIVDTVAVLAEQAPDDGYYAEQDDGCSGDSSDGYDQSSLSEDPETDCDGEPIDAADDEDDAGCSGDSSDGADDEGGCSGDPEDSSDDGGCSGDPEDASSDGSDDDGCGTDESSARARSTVKKRPKLSVLALGLVFFVMPIRRLTRPER